MAKTYLIEIIDGTTTHSNIEGYQTEGEGVVFGIASGSMSLEQILCKGQFAFGECNSAKFEVTLFNLPIDVAGKAITVSILDDVGTATRIFTGRIDSSTQDKLNFFREIVAYDIMYFTRDKDVSTSWNGNALWTSSSPETLKNLRNRLCAAVGLNTLTSQIPLTNDSLTFPAHFVELPSVSFGTVLKMICEMQACFPVINTFGRVQFIKLPVSGVTKNIEGAFDNNESEFEDYRTNSIDSIGVYSTSNELAQIIGTTHNNTYNISGNLFALNMSSTELSTAMGNVLETLNNFRYTPAKIEMIISDTSIQLGQKLTTGNNRIHYVLSNYLYDSTLIRQTIGSQAAGRTMDAAVPTVNNEIINLGKFSTIEQTIDGITTRVGDAEGNITTLTQTATGLASTVESQGTRLGTAESKISQQADKIELVVGSDDVIKAAKIVEAINGAQSTVKIEADHIVLDGNVVVKNDLTDGTTQISGDNIKTGKINADRIDGHTLNIDDAVIDNCTIKANCTIEGSISAQNVSIRDTNNQVIFLADAQQHKCTIGPLTVDANGMENTGATTSGAFVMKVFNPTGTRNPYFLVRSPNAGPYIILDDRNGAGNAILSQFTLKGCRVAPVIGSESFDLYDKITDLEARLEAVEDNVDKLTSMFSHTVTINTDSSCSVGSIVRNSFGQIVKFEVTSAGEHTDGFYITFNAGSAGNCMLSKMRDITDGETINVANVISNCTITVRHS